MHYPELKKVERTFGKIGAIIQVATSAYMVAIPLILRQITQSDEMVGYYYTALSILGFIFSLISGVIFSNFSKIKVFKYNIMGGLILLFSMTALQEHFSFLAVNLIRAFSMSFIWMSISLMIRELVQKEKVKTALVDYGQYTTVGAMAGGLLGGYAAKYFGNGIVFIIGGVLFTIALIMFIRMSIYHDLEEVENHLNEDRENATKIEQKKESFFTVFKSFFKDSQYRTGYFLGVFGGIWDAFIALYTPIMVVRLQYNQDMIANIGVAASILVLIMGARIIKLPDRLGYKRTFILGWVGLIGMALALSFLNHYETAFIIFGLLILSRIPNLMCNSNRIYYFYRYAGDDTNKYLGMYGLAWKSGQVIGPLIGAKMLTISLMVFNNDTLDIMWRMMACMLVIPILLSFKIYSNRQLEEKKA